MMILPGSHLENQVVIVTTHKSSIGGEGGNLAFQANNTMRIVFAVPAVATIRSAKVMYRAAIAYNLKKYLRFTPVDQSGMVIALLIPGQFYHILIYFCNSHVEYVNRQKIEIVKVVT